MKEKKLLVNIILGIIILILILINIKVFMDNYIKENENRKLAQNKLEYNASTEEEDNQNRRNKISSLDGKKRVQTYFGMYISYIESKNYEDAYNLLYDGFKQSYFPTIDEFKNYIIQKYPSNMIINYTDISREGDLYLLKLEIKDALNSSKQQQGENIQVVIREEEINNFKISFEVK